MDYNTSSELWEWQGEDYHIGKDSNLNMSECIWDGVTENDEDLSYMFDETTPIKNCGDLAYNVSNENLIKQPVECRQTSSQVKRRRMLQFPEDVTSSTCSEISSPFLKSKERDVLVEEALPEESHWVSCFPENASAGYESIDQTSDGWLADCFNDSEMQFSPDEMNLSTASDVQIDVSEFCNVPPDSEANMVQQTITRAHRNVVFKGRKSFIHTPRKLPSSIAYPFAFIKPCGAHGDITLKDINQRIRTPPSKLKQTGEDASAAYPTSAFSGKPVVGKTKIRTEGGKGSITIMRTKG